METPNTGQMDVNTPAAAETAPLKAKTPVAAKAQQDIMAETTRFLMDRLQQDIDAQKAMLACKSLTELLQVQADFFKSAMEQYTEYASRFYTVMATTADDTVKTARSGHSRRYDDVPV